MEETATSCAQATCEEHEGERLRFYCTFHNDVICSVCAIKRHKLCQDTLTLTEAIERFEREHQNLMKALDNQSQAITKAVEEKRNALQSLSPDSNEVSDKINKLCAKLHAIIDEKKASLLSQLQHEASTLNKELSSDVSFLNKMASTMSKVKAKAKRAFQGKSPMKTVQSMIKVQNTYCDIEKSSQIVLSHPTQVLTFEESNDMHEFIVNLQSLGVVAKEGVLSNGTLDQTTDRPINCIPDELLGAVGGVLSNISETDDLIASDMTSLSRPGVIPCLPEFESSTETDSDISDEVLDAENGDVFLGESKQRGNALEKPELMPSLKYDDDLSTTVAIAKDVDRQMSELINDIKTESQGENSSHGIDSPFIPICMAVDVNETEDKEVEQKVYINPTNEVDDRDGDTEVNGEVEDIVTVEQGEVNTRITKLDDSNGTGNTEESNQNRSLVTVETEERPTGNLNIAGHSDHLVSETQDENATVAMVEAEIGEAGDSVDNLDTVRVVELGDTMSSGYSLTETMKADREVEGIICKSKDAIQSTKEPESSTAVATTKRDRECISLNSTLESPQGKHVESQIAGFNTVDHGKTCWIYGVEFVNAVRIIVSDVSHDSLQLFDTRGNFQCEQIVPFTPWGISRMDDQRIVVCSGIKGVVYVYQVDDEGFEQLNNFDVGNDCNAIRFVNDKFYVGSRQGFIVFSETGERIAAIDKAETNTNVKQLRRVDFIAVNEMGDKVFLVNSWSGRISCITLAGELLWEIDDRRIYPKGIALENGTLFVASKLLNAITCVDIATGAPENDVTSENLEFPYAIAHHPSEKLLIVTKWDENMRQDETREVRMLRFSTQI